jgi:hypothetical protein
MNLLALRDRIRTKAIANSLTYTEIETLFDVNELLNQTMPCLAWRYSGETNNFEEVGTEMSLNIYLLTNFPDSVKTETADYQRDYIITQQDALRTFFYTWLQAMPFESGSDFLEVLSTEEIPIAERLSINAFLTMEFRVNISIKRDFCVEPEEIAPTADEVKVYFNSVLKYTQACNVDLELTLKNQDGDDITAAFTGYDIVVTQPVAADASVNNSDSSYTASVASGGTLALPDITISNSNNSFTTTSPSVKNVDLADITVGNSDDSYSVTSPSNIKVEVPDEAITVNSAAFITKPSAKDQDILLKDVSGTTITPVSLAGNTITILDAVVDTGWSRPTEWIALPSVETKTLYGLYLVFENSYNTLSVLAKGAGDMEIDWENDGTIVTSNGSIQSYTYNYASLGGSINQYTEDGSNRNYKQVIFKMKHIANFTNGAYTRLDSNNGINDNGSNQFADINADFSGISTRFHLSLDKKQPYLRMLKVTDVGTNSRFWYGQQDLDLKVFDVPSPFSPEYQSFAGTTIAHSLNDLNPSGASCLANFKCVSVNNIGGGRDLDGGSFGFCNNINSTESTGLCFGVDINILGTVTLTDTNFQRAFQNCTTKKLIFASLPPQPTNMASNGGCFLGMVNLEEMIVPGLQNGFTIAGSNMGATALDAMFTSLGTANGAQTITITGNPGAATCTTSIATAKGFTIVI